MILTQKRLIELVHYDPDTGVFTRRVKVGHEVVGSNPGHIRSGGYIHFGVDYCKYAAHRLAWLYMTGRMPKLDIDHINRIRNDNRFCNLREISRSHNLENSVVAKSHNKSTGILGAYANGRGFISRICIRGKDMYLGYYGTAAEAHAAYMAAKNKHHLGYCQ